METRIYVACLAAYNSGKLHGRWIDANQEADAIRDEVQAMLKESPEPQAEEWAIHDYELGGIRISESEDFEWVAEVAGLLAEHGEAFAAYANNVGVDSATAEGFQDSYRGHYDSERAFAEELVSELYSEKELGPLANYIDYESYANDLLMGDFYSVNGEGGVYVFSNH